MARSKTSSAGAIRVGVGGWIFEPWRGVFYPADLTQKLAGQLISVGKDDDIGSRGGALVGSTLCLPGKGRETKSYPQNQA